MSAASSSPLPVSVYVEGFPYDITIELLEETLRKAAKGVVEVRAPAFQDSGRLRGFAHVDFVDQASATKALTSLDKLPIGARFLTASIAKTKRGENVTLPTDDQVATKATSRLFVRNLSFKSTEEELKYRFANHGTVDSVRIVRRSDTGQSKGFGYVEFARIEDAVQAVTAARKEPISLDGRILSLDFDTDRPKRSFKDAQGKSVFKSKVPKAAKQVGVEPEKKRRKKDA